MRPCLKSKAKTNQDKWTWQHRHVIPATWKAEAGGWQVQGQAELQSEFKACLGDLVRPYLKIKSKTVLGV